jgi:putative intracellular protease/amidase
VALLSTLDDPAGYQKALIDGKADEAAKLAKGWPYAGYKMTVFSTVEEKQVEGKVQLGGDVLFYPEAALEKAGAITINAPAWQSHVVEDRELVTGQQPSSDQELGKALVAKLLAKSS